jgi:hypothetical protein
MNQRPTLDPSTFEGLLAAAWVLQCQQEQEARNRQHAPDETLAEPPETHVEPRRGSECDTTNARLIVTSNDGLSIANIFIEKEISIKNIDFFFFIAEQFNTLSTCKSKGL